jgi:hypothetical protein
MYWIYTSGVHEIAILAVGDLALVLAAGISLFWIIQHYSILSVQFLILSSRHGSVLTKFRYRSDFMPDPEDT